MSADMTEINGVLVNSTSRCESEVSFSIPNFACITQTLRAQPAHVRMHAMLKPVKVGSSSTGIS
jgi:hypothetical protein